MVELSVSFLMISIYRNKTYTVGGVALLGDADAVLGGGALLAHGDLRPLAQGVGRVDDSDGIAKLALLDGDEEEREVLSELEPLDGIKVDLGVVDVLVLLDGVEGDRGVIDVLALLVRLGEADDELGVGVSRSLFALVARRLQVLL